MRIFPGPNVQSDDEFLAAATERGTTTFHPGCTCRMGPADARWAVVDDQLRVHGLQGLRVIDASIMPRMISANLNASTLMIADKASDMIRGKAAPEAVKIAAIRVRRRRTVSCEGTSMPNATKEIRLQQRRTCARSATIRS